MLKNIKSCISPELLKVLMEMGHGDEIVLADGNFPAASHAQQLVRLDGNQMTHVLKGILELLPLDHYVKNPISLMMHGEEVGRPAIWNDFEKVIKSEGYPFNVQYLERSHFYNRAKSAYCIVATSEQALYANIILKKGVIETE
nr:RbsD/FucU domain-containing protein [Lysinibacillus timonensis]